MSTTRRPEFTPSAPVPRDMFQATSTVEGAKLAIDLYNNCNIKAVKGRWILIHATTFVCAGIARQLGFNVYRALPEHGADHWVVDTRRPS